MATQRIIYGTAWKQEKTTSLVISAVLSGYRGIDTACQPKHYREDLVGEALQTLGEQHGISREQLFLQTKFTPIAGQDRNKPLPYDPSSRLETQIQSSFQRSLQNLRTTYLDSLLLHTPLDSISRTITAWRTLMALQDSGKVKFIGVSNTYDVGILEALENDGGRRVQIVQNRWYEGNGWDKEVVKYCRKNDVQYQSFWTLTGAPGLLQHPTLLEFSNRSTCTPAQALFKLCQSHGITPLTGTSSEQHMSEDLAVETMGVDAESELLLGELADLVGLESCK